MLPRREVFPHVIEINYQARQRLGCCVYLVFNDQNEWLLIDIGYEDTVG
ncbi:MAG TPA: MBL fold metallo-hydrolase, partial [Planctomycetaceae bacterium]|nr:MBL fold metallo-hydrolase [Planctomycetaceae bacterium]